MNAHITMTNNKSWRHIFCIVVITLISWNSSAQTGNGPYRTSVIFQGQPQFQFPNSETLVKLNDEVGIYVGTVGNVFGIFRFNFLDESFYLLQRLVLSYTPRGESVYLGPSFFKANNKAFLSIHRALYATDGTREGTHYLLTSNIIDGDYWGYEEGIKFGGEIKNQLIFSKEDGVWSSDGTPRGTRRINNDSVSNFFTLFDGIYYTGSRGISQGIFKLSTSGRSSSLTVNYSGSSSLFFSNSNLGNTIYFCDYPNKLLRFRSNALRPIDGADGFNCNDIISVGDNIYWNDANSFYRNNKSAILSIQERGLVVSTEYESSNYISEIFNANETLYSVENISSLIGDSGAYKITTTIVKHSTSENLPTKIHQFSCISSLQHASCLSKIFKVLDSNFLVFRKYEALEYGDPQHYFLFNPKKDHVYPIFFSQQPSHSAFNPLQFEIKGNFFGHFVFTRNLNDFSPSIIMKTSLNVPVVSPQIMMALDN